VLEGVLQRRLHDPEDGELGALPELEGAALLAERQFETGLPHDPEQLAHRLQARCRQRHRFTLLDHREHPAHVTERLPSAPGENVESAQCGLRVGSARVLCALRPRDQPGHGLDRHVLELADDPQPCGLLGECKLAVDASPLEIRTLDVEPACGAPADEPEDEEDDRRDHGDPGGDGPPSRAGITGREQRVHRVSFSARARARCLQETLPAQAVPVPPHDASGRFARRTSRRARYSVSSMSPFANLSASVFSAAWVPCDAHGP
jgi:hypothetical protein